MTHTTETITIRIPDSLETQLGVDPREIVAREYGWRGTGDAVEFVSNHIRQEFVHKLKLGAEKLHDQRKVQIIDAIDKTLTAL